MDGVLEAIGTGARSAGTSARACGSSAASCSAESAWASSASVASASAAASATTSADTASICAPMLTPLVVQAERPSEKTASARGTVRMRIVDKAVPSFSFAKPPLNSA